MTITLSWLTPSLMYQPSSSITLPYSSTRTLVDHFTAMSGIPLLAVFDRPKPVALHWKKNGEVTEWNPIFAALALDLGLGLEVCWPHAPNLSIVCSNAAAC
ncbi:MAG: hypothetical protein ACT443_05675 [Gemmatimonadota bacterium]